MFNPLFDLNVSGYSAVETSASTPVSSRLPVISSRKSSHLPWFPTVDMLILDGYAPHLEKTIAAIDKGRIR
jgi:hypothetical protein